MANRSKVEIEDLGFLRLTGQRLKTPEKTLQRIGAMMTNKSQKAFKDQGRPEGTWAERGVPNIAGILSDLERGSGIPDRRFESRPALIDTRRLENSISWQIISRTAVEIGTNLEYAPKLHEGGKQVIPVTETMKEGLADLMQSHPEHKSTWQGLMEVDQVEFDIPARPIVEILPEDVEDIREIIAMEVTGEE